MSAPGRSAATVLRCGKWGPAFLTFARRCAAHGCPTYFLEITARHPAWRKYSKHLAGGGCFDESLLGTDDGLDAIRHYARSIRADAVVPMTEDHLLWLARHRDVLEPECRILTAPLRTLELLASKKEQILLAGAAGFSVLPTWVLTAPAEMASIPETAYPVAVRPDWPYVALPSFKVACLTSASKLRRFVAGLPGLEHPLVVQPFRPWPNLLVHGIRAEDGRILALRAFLVYRKFQGLALSLREAPFSPGLAEACQAFVEAAGVVGCFHFDLLFSPKDQRAYYLEINPRLGGTTEKVAKLGYDEPTLTLAAFGFPMLINRPLPAGAPPKNGGGYRAGRPVANRRALIKHMLYALRGRLSELDYPATGRLRHFWRSCVECVSTQDSIFDWRDLRGSLWFYLRV